MWQLAMFRPCDNAGTQQILLSTGVLAAGLGVRKVAGRFGLLADQADSD
jgi:hypothetical protein